MDSLLAFPKRGLRGRKLMPESRRRLLSLNIYVLCGFFHAKHNRSGFAGMLLLCSCCFQVQQEHQILLNLAKNNVVYLIIMNNLEKETMLSSLFFYLYFY